MVPLRPDGATKYSPALGFKFIFPLSLELPVTIFHAGVVYVPITTPELFTL